MSQPRILAIAGSRRTASVNVALVRATAAIAESAGATVTVLDLRDYDIPMYDGDAEAADGIPADVVKVKELFKQHDGLLIASPEYNSSIAPILKNLIDWASRPHGDEGQLACFAGKVAGLLAASPGALGGLRGLNHVRDILGNIRVHVIPAQHALGGAMSAFNEDGSLADEKQAAAVTNVVNQLVETTRRLHA